MPSIKFRRVYEPVKRGDGARILIDRLWPRGISKKNAHIERWLRELAPSTALRKWFGHKPERWAEFQRRYRAELRVHQDELRRLRLLARRRPLTLVYSARDTEHNDAVVLREVLLRNLRQGVKRQRTASRHQSKRPANRSVGGAMRLRHHQ